MVQSQVLQFILSLVIYLSLGLLLFLHCPSLLLIYGCSESSIFCLGRWPVGCVNGNAITSYFPGYYYVAIFLPLSLLQVFLSSLYTMRLLLSSHLQAPLRVYRLACPRAQPSTIMDARSRKHEIYLRQAPSRYYVAIFLPLKFAFGFFFSVRLSEFLCSSLQVILVCVALLDHLQASVVPATSIFSVLQVQLLYQVVYVGMCFLFRV
jgi:hypothetical protein